MQEKVKKPKIIQSHKMRLCYTHHTLSKNAHLVAFYYICKHFKGEIALLGFHIWTAKHGLHVVNHLVA